MSADKLHVILDGPHPGAVNMQRDEDLLRAWRPGRPPVLRLYRWRPYAVSYGLHQRLQDFDHDAIARLAEKMGTANGRVTAINGYGASTFSTRSFASFSPQP